MIMKALDEGLAHFEWTHQRIDGTPFPADVLLTRMERDGLIRRARDPADQRRTVVEATVKGRKLVEKLSRTIEAHYAWLEQSLGKQKLIQLYGLLDELIALEQP
jgi:DNA-binding MarR family transcriptional regulator